MRTLFLLPFTLLTAACWTPGPGQADPTRYPWDQPKPAGTYCVVSLEQPGASGITIGGQSAMQMGCSVGPSRRED
jgi:hypothetical protein